MKRKFNNYAISEVIGTNLLILITMIMFSLLLTSVFTIFEPNVEPPSANILCQVNENNIKLNHIGGEPLSTDTKIIFEIGQEQTQEYTVNDFLNNDLKSNGWEFGESFVISSIETYGREIKINLLDKDSNSFIFSSTIPSPSPLNTFVNSISSYIQTGSPLLITATSLDTAPDNISLWYKWEGFWEDTFENNDTYTMSYNNVSFSGGDFASVNVSGIQQESNEVVENNNSDVDGSSDIGAHSDFNNQKLKDGISDILTEGHTGGGYIDTLLSENFEGNPWNENWDNTISNWYVDTTHNRSGANSSRSNSSNDGIFDCNDLDTSNADLIVINFWYYLDNTENSDIELYYYNGFSWVFIDEFGGGTKDTWLQYTDSIIDPQYLISNFKIRLNTNLGNDENIWIDDVTVQISIPGTYSNELELEIQWLNVNYQLPYEELCIYVTSISNEELKVEYWNVTDNSWHILFNNISVGWNNISINNFLTSSTFTVRFNDSQKILDDNQNSWEIDYVIIHVWEQVGTIFYEGNLTSIDITKPINRNWSNFNANVKNLQYCNFNILDNNNNLLIGNLNGSNNNISTISNNTIRLNVVFNGSNKLYSWNVGFGNQNWTEYDVDTNSSDGWSWSFNFNLGNGVYSFYSIGEKNGWYDEQVPTSPTYDTKCYYII